MALDRARFFRAVPYPSRCSVGWFVVPFHNYRGEFLRTSRSIFRYRKILPYFRNGHTTSTVPHSVRSVKLSIIGPCYYSVDAVPCTKLVHKNREFLNPTIPFFNLFCFRCWHRKMSHPALMIIRLPPPTHRCCYDLHTISCACASYVVFGFGAFGLFFYSAGVAAIRSIRLVKLLSGRR